MPGTFKSGDAIRSGWRFTKDNFALFAGVVAITLAASFVPRMLAETLGHRFFAIRYLILAAGWALQLLIGIGTIRIALGVFDRKPVRIADIFSGADLLFRYFLGSALYYLIVLAGFVLLIVPGIVWAVKYQFFALLIVDKKLSPMDAIRKSGEITKGSKGKLFVLIILLFLINLAGLICLFIGLFATVPLAIMANVYAYRKLLGETAPEKEPSEKSAVEAVSEALQA